MTEKSETLSPIPPTLKTLNAKPPVKLSKQIQHLAEYIALRFVAAWLSLLPYTQALWIGRAIGRLIGLLLASRDLIAKNNILASLPEISEKEADRIVIECWKNLGEGAAEFVKLPSLSKEEILAVTDFEGIEPLRQSYATGKGVLMITAHYGAWELGAKFWPFSGFETAVVARLVKNPWVNDFVTKIRACEGVKVILSRDAVRETVRWLKHGKLLALLIDHRVTEGSLKIPFFGRPASTTALPAILALRYGVPVHMVHSWRENGRVKIHVSPALDFSGLKATESDIAEATLRMNAVVENWIRERPSAWLWIHNRWKITN